MTPSDPGRESQLRLAGASPGRESYVRTDERTEILPTAVDHPAVRNAQRASEESQSEVKVEWQPGDPLYVDPRCPSQRFIYNFRDDADSEDCHCADAARWPEPTSARKLAIDGDELGDFIDEYHAWAARGRPEPAEPATPEPPTDPTPRLIARALSHIAHAIAVHL